jgi:RNA polymerase-binding transcription factor DksA
MTEKEILEISKQCGAMKHYFRDDLLTFVRLIEQRKEDEIESLRQRVAELATDWQVTQATLAACEKERDELKQDINACPNCGGPADQGHDRCYLPTAYLCSKCQSTTEDCSAVQTKG